jgi:hypothetical protein
MASYAEPITANFYKLLIYNEGSFFVSHRDTEKAPVMFATLVIVLPSALSGGELQMQLAELKSVGRALNAPSQKDVGFTHATSRSPPSAARRAC